MSIEKTTALILSVLPYRESSCILYLFTRTHGLMHGIAKGILKQDKRMSNRPERGFLCESNMYVRNNRELHTLADFQVTDYYPSIRGNLVRTAFRDAGFELVLKSVTVTDPHPELFDLLTAFCSSLGSSAPRDCYPVLWSFYIQFCTLLGFGLTLDECVVCRKPFNGNGPCFCVIEMGGLVCSECSRQFHGRQLIPGAYLPILRDARFESVRCQTADTPAADLLRLTLLLASYCRYHFEIRSEFATLEFIRELKL
jgi:DNA repair protein RecO